MSECQSCFLNQWEEQILFDLWVCFQWKEFGTGLSTGVTQACARVFDREHLSDCWCCSETGLGYHWGCKRLADIGGEKPWKITAWLVSSWDLIQRTVGGKTGEKWAWTRVRGGPLSSVTSTPLIRSRSRRLEALLLQKRHSMAYIGSCHCGSRQQWSPGRLFYGCHWIYQLHGQVALKNKKWRRVRHLGEVNQQGCWFSSFQNGERGMTGGYEPGVYTFWANLVTGPNL